MKYEIKIVLILALLFVIFNLWQTNAFSQSPGRAVLIEEFTGEWCGWCPTGMMELENLKEKYGDTLIIVAVHTSDIMEAASADGMMDAWASFAPSALINRGYDTILQAQIFSTEEWDQIIAREINNPAPCDIHLAYSFNETTREITATVSATFTQNYIGDGRLNLYIVEDNVIGESQSNYLSGNPDFINTPFYNLPEHIDNFSHQHVLREMVGESYGIDGIIADTVSAGQQFEYTFNYTVPADYKLEDLHLIGVAQQYKGLKKYRKILNSVHYKFSSNGASINNLPHSFEPVISPNPASNQIQIKMINSEIIQNVKIFTINGSLVYQETPRCEDVFVNTQNFTNGCYIVVVVTDVNIYQRKIIINK